MMAEGKNPHPPDPFMIFMIIIGPVAGYSAYRVNHSRQEKS